MFVAAAAPTLLNPTMRLLREENMTIKDILELPREKRCGFPGEITKCNNHGGDPRTFNKHRDWERYKWLDIVPDPNGGYTAFCFISTLHYYDRLADGVPHKMVKLVSPGVPVSHSFLNNINRLSKHEQADTYQNAIKWYQSQGLLANVVSPGVDASVAATDYAHVGTANGVTTTKRSRGEDGAPIKETVWTTKRAAECIDMIDRWLTVKEFRDCILFGDVRDALKTLSDAQKGNTGESLIEWANLWAHDLDKDGNTEAYRQANRLDACRKVALYFLYKLADRCHFEKRNGEANWDLQYVKKNIRGHHIYKILGHCLAMDKFKGLVFVKANWYAEEHENEFDPKWKNNTGPLIDYRYKWIRENLMSSSEADSFKGLFEATFRSTESQVGPAASQNAGAATAATNDSEGAADSDAESLDTHTLQNTAREHLIAPQNDQTSEGAESLLFAGMQLGPLPVQFAGATAATNNSEGEIDFDASQQLYQNTDDVDNYIMEYAASLIAK